MTMPLMRLSSWATRWSVVTIRSMYGMLAGAAEYWLFARQPCKLPSCEEVMTAQRRLRLILAEVEKTVEGADSNDQDRRAHTGAT